jgi:protein involved in polysaccharide export with SLBB domain
MAKRLLLAGLTVLCLTVSLLAQTPIKLDPIKLGPLHSGDWVRITFHEIQGVAVFSGALMVIRDDGNIVVLGDVPYLDKVQKVQAAGLTVSRLKQVLEKQFDAVVTVTFIDPPRWASILLK